MEREKEVMAFWPKLDKKGEPYFSGYVDREALERLLEASKKAPGDKVNIVMFYNKFWRKKNGRPKLLGFVTKGKISIENHQ